jgi:hypothetical protein
VSPWLPLRDHLRAELARQLDHALLRDPSLAAWLAGRRAATLERLVDAAELCVLRRLLAQRMQAADRADPQTLH